VRDELAVVSADYRIATQAGAPFVAIETVGTDDSHNSGTGISGAGPRLSLIVPSITGLEVARAVLGDRFAGRPIVLGGARRIGVDYRSQGNPCVSASGTRPLLQTVLAIISTERSDAVGSGESAIGGRVGRSPMFAAVWLAVSAELVRPMVGGPAPAARWCRH
jgi:hypothetical protein